MSALWAPPPRGGADAPKSADRTGTRALREGSRLKAVPPPPARMARIPFMAVLIAVFGLGMAGLLMLNTTLQNQAFEGRSLSRQANELIYSQSELESEISRLAAPQELARRASALGMRPNTHPAFVVVPSGKVIGDPRRVTGKEVPALVIKTPAELAAARAAAEARRKAAAVEKAARERAEQLAAARRVAQQRAAAEAAARQRTQTDPAQTNPAQTNPAQRNLVQPGQPSAAQPTARRDPSPQPLRGN